MQKYVVPDPLAAELERFGDGVELCDAAGRRFGFFVPAVDLSGYEAAEPDLSDEELDRIEQSTEWHSTAEVLRRLENRG